MVRPVGEAGDPSAHDALIVGSPVYDQRRLPEAEDYARAHAGALASRPVWLFSVGTFGDRKRLVGTMMRREPKGIGELEAAIRPRGYRVFAGVIDRHQWPFLPRLLYRALGGRLGDNRDWPAIDAWADGIAADLEAPAPSHRG